MQANYHHFTDENFCIHALCEWDEDYQAMLGSSGMYLDTDVVYDPKLNHLLIPPMNDKEAEHWMWAIMPYNTKQRRIFQRNFHAWKSANGVCDFDVLKKFTWDVVNHIYLSDSYFNLLVFDSKDQLLLNKLSLDPNTFWYQFLQ